VNRPLNMRQVVEIDPGAGNLDVRACMAAVMGPQRAAFGNKSAKALQEGQPTQLGVNSGNSGQVAYMAVTLSPLDAGGPRLAIIDGQSQPGGSSIPVVFDRTLASAAGIGYAAILLPGDELYAQSIPGQGTFAVVVSLVWF